MNTVQVTETTVETVVTTRKKSVKVAAKKDQLLTLAKTGEKRPTQVNHPLGSALSTYTSPSQGSYDPEFERVLRELRPDWFRKAKTI